MIYSKPISMSKIKRYLTYQVVPSYGFGFQSTAFKEKKIDVVH